MTKEVYTINAYDGLCKAERIMDEKDTACLPVIKDGKLVGIITTRDLRRTHPNRIAADAMTKSIVSVQPDTSLWEAKRLFEDKKVHELLVLKDGNPVGLVTKASLYAELGKHTDLLTGLYKSEYIYHMGVELLENGSEIAVIFIDLNNFGQIDKEYGHATGDKVLKEIGVLLKNHHYGDTYLCRFGGDEFVVLAPYKLEKCKLLADMLLKAVSTHHFAEHITVTASAGVAGGKRPAGACNTKELLLDLINLASLASTRAKREKTALLGAEGPLPGKPTYDTA